MKKGHFLLGQRFPVLLLFSELCWTHLAVNLTHFARVCRKMMERLAGNVEQMAAAVAYLKESAQIEDFWKPQFGVLQAQIWLQAVPVERRISESLP